jgi:pimeloyl-ACP methyl ester carboxylesterase
MIWLVQLQIQLSRPMHLRLKDCLLVFIAAIAIGAGLWNLRLATQGLDISTAIIEGIPTTVFKPSAAAKGPVIIIAHGFAGSQQLMRPFATTFAQNGYTAITFDFAGHGRNTSALRGNIIEVGGATQTLVRETARIAKFGRELGDGRIAVLGHSMASDIVVRFAQAESDVKATIAVSMFSPAVTAQSPSNLLVIVGEWEGMLKQEALRVVGLLSSPTAAVPGVTYGDGTSGNTRRAAISNGVEHVSVLYSRASMQEALSWLDTAFNIKRNSTPYLDATGPWIILLLSGIVMLAWPLSSLLPIVSSPAIGAALPWRQLLLPLLLPMMITPFVLRVLPTRFLPVLVGDYLAAHFAMYGLITALCLVALRRRAGLRAPVALRLKTVLTPQFLMAALVVVAFGFIALVWPINLYVTSFVPGATRALLISAMLLGTLLFFLADEWVTRGMKADGAASARGAYAATKIAFLVSLAIAVGLDFERLFFLLIIIPVIVPFFVVYGLFSGWIYHRTGHPFIAGIANAVAFAWAVGVTFPLLAG